VGVARTTLDPELTILAARDVVALVARLVRERSWGLLATLFGAIASEPNAPLVSPSDLDTATRLLVDALAVTPPPKNPRSPAGEELRAVRLRAAEALLCRVSRPPVGELERRALDRAAGLLVAAGDHRRAATTYEDLADDARAADAWGALGDLERMEAALDRDERRASAQRAATEAMHRFEALLAAGDRREAIAAAAMLSGVAEAGSARQTAARLESRLVRARAVTFRIPGGPSLRIAAVPAYLGRDHASEILLRDPGVSRRHARVRAGEGSLYIEDAGSRGGLRLGGARIDGALPLLGSGELALGAATVLRYQASAQVVVFEGAAGLDRSLRALVGVEPVALAPLLPEAEGLSLDWRSGAARLIRAPGLPVRVDGCFIGAGCDLLHGDVVELDGARRLQLEVVSAPRPSAPGRRPAACNRSSKRRRGPSGRATPRRPRARFAPTCGSTRTT
jgi:hypothetical protein